MEGRLLKPRIAVLASSSPTGEFGGAERLFDGVCKSLNTAGAVAELVEVASDERDFAAIRQSYLRFYDLDLTLFDGVVSMKGPAYAVRHRNHVCYLMHTMRAYYDMFGMAFPNPSRRRLEQRRLVCALDTAALQRTRALLAIGHEVAARLHYYNGLEATIVRPPTPLAGLRRGRFEYLLLPGRLHAWKRVDLAIEAMRYVTSPVELVISGCGDDEARLRNMAKANDRIRFTGRVSDAELIDLYADALSIVFMPRKEDLGLVTLEAFHSGKPVVTCRDSGEPARIVCEGKSGFICDPEPRQIAARIDELALQPDLAAEMGQFGRASVASITWERVATALLSALGFREMAVSLRTAA